MHRSISTLRSLYLLEDFSFLSQYQSNTREIRILDFLATKGVRHVTRGKLRLLTYLLEVLNENISFHITSVAQNITLEVRVSSQILELNI